MHYLIVPTQQAIAEFESETVSMIDASYDLAQTLRMIIDQVVRQDVNGCVTYDVISTLDHTGLYYAQDHECYRHACIGLAVALNQIFRGCHLYHDGFLPYDFELLLGFDLVLRAHQTRTWLNHEPYRY